MIYNKCNSKNAINYCRRNMCTIARFCTLNHGDGSKLGDFFSANWLWREEACSPPSLFFFLFFLAVISAGSYYFSSEIHFPLSSTLWLFVLISYLILMLPVVVCGSLSLWFFLFTNDGWSNYSLKNFGDGGGFVFYLVRTHD